MVKMGIAQTKPKLGDIDYNIADVKQLLDVASKMQVDVLTLPELANSGYVFRTQEEAKAASEQIPTGEFSKILQAWSKKDRLIVSGVCESSENVLYNSAVVFANGNHLGTYRKIHLFNNEKDWFQPGRDEPPVIEFGGNRYGIMICWDWAFPEIARILALKGSQVILHPANLVLQYCQDAMRTRSIENGVFTVTANRIGTERKVAFSGKSQITDTKGNVILSMPESDVAIDFIEIDASKADNKMLTDRNHLLDDRRPELYQRLTRSS